MAPSSQKYKAGRITLSATSGPQVLEGAWWKQEPGVTGFVTLSNTTDQPLPATLQVSDANAKPLGSYQVTISPHGTKRIDLQELTANAETVGGLHVTYSGAPDAVIVNGSLEDLAKGYSASIPFAVPPPASAKITTLNYAEIGLMVGAMDPMMHFPTSTVFAPYSVLRNIGTQAATITPVIYWMEGGTARSARQSAITLGPLQAKNLDVVSLMEVSGLRNFNGLLNVILEIQGPQDSVLLSGGSVDQTYTYVFEVIPNAAKVSGSKNLGYWSTANGDDTMVTMWNPADEAQDFIFKIFFTGGHYLLPVHLGPRATYMFNLSEIIDSQSPDSEGNLIPLAVHDGSAQISGTQGDNQLILVAVDVGTYNVRKATCAYRCITCNGATSWAMSVIPFATGIGGSTQLTLEDTWNTGIQHDITKASTWSSSATNFATVSAGLVNGIAVGSVTINGEDMNDPWYGSSCGSPPPACPEDQGGGADGPGSVTPTIASISPSRGLIGATTASVTISGKGFTGGHVNTPATIQVSNITTFTDTQIVLDFVVSTTATPGNNAVSVTASGEQSNAVNFFVQVPTSLLFVSGSASGTTEKMCVLNVACGTIVSFKYQVQDQDSPAQPIKASMSMWDSFGSTFSPDGLQMQGTTFLTTCSPNQTNSGPCNVSTYSDGTFIEGALGACSGVCYANGACTTGGPSGIPQTWHIATQAIVQQISEYCQKVLVNGVQIQ